MRTRYTLRGFRHYWRSHAAIILGTAVAAAMLVGSLLVGDSVRHSLRLFALQRLGQVDAAMVTHGHYVDGGLAARLSATLREPVVPALTMHGVVLVEDEAGERRQLNHVQVIGVDARFWALSPGPAPTITADSAAVSRNLAERLEIAAGQEVSLRISRPSLMPRDAPLAARSEKLTRRGTFGVSAVLSDQEFGRFSLAANQIAPYNIFVDLAWLQQTAGLVGKVNTLLTGGPENRTVPLQDGLDLSWKLADVGVSLRPCEGGLQLESERVFLTPATATAAMLGEGAVGTLAYLVNKISLGEKSTPYSFAISATPSANSALSLVPEDLEDDHAVINQWLATQVDAEVGDTIAVAYYELLPSGKFEERTREFSVHSILPMSQFMTERDRMPEFPGLTDVDSCSDWDVGMPMDEAALEDEANEAYWERYRETPKLAVTLEAGREMWANRFGNTSAVRYPGTELQIEDLQRELTSALSASALGLFFVPVRELALRAVDEAMSFGELFVSLSFFLIASALMLTALMFVFGIQQRAEEIGILLGVGWPRPQVALVLLGEASVSAVLGAGLGSIAGIGVTKALLAGLTGNWQGAVAGTPVVFHLEPATLLIGFLVTVICALLAMALTLRKLLRREPRALLAGSWQVDQAAAAGRWIQVAGWGCFLGALGCVGFGLSGAGQHAVYVFFGAGFLLLMSGLCAARFLLVRLDQRGRERLTSLALGLRNSTRRRARSLTAVVLLASGTFLVIAVSSMQQDLARYAHQRSSGTGGFAFIGEATLPFPDPLESAQAQETFRLEDSLNFISCKVRDGDDASCFNLNRAQSPRLLGVPVEPLASRGAFVPSPDDELWQLLNLDLGPNVMPGLVGDANTAMWTLRKKVDVEQGDELVYRDESGAEFRVRLVGQLPSPLTILQGTVLISHANFATRFPSEPGYRMVLVDVLQGREGQAERLPARLERFGLALTPALTRLQEFHSVEAAYLRIFMILGGLGVVLGTLGLGALVLRNVLERRSELALLRAVGYSRKALRSMVLGEHWLLLALGLLLGSVSALVAVSPTLAAPGMHVPVAAILSLLATLAAVGVLSVMAATRWALSGRLLSALRDE